MNTFTLTSLRIVLLAAGYSTRLGSPKALARVGGRSLLQRSIATLTPFAWTAPIIVVTPPRARRLRSGFQRIAVDFLPNPQRADGLSSSVRVGLWRARRASAVMLIPVDLVELEPRDIARLIARWRLARRNIVARELDGGAAATPLILPRWLYSKALGLTGDQGLRDVVRRLPKDRTLLMRLDSAERDVDTKEDLARARSRVRPARR